MPVLTRGGPVDVVLAGNLRGDPHVPRSPLSPVVASVWDVTREPSFAIFGTKPYFRPESGLVRLGSDKPSPGGGGQLPSTLQYMPEPERFLIWRETL